MVEEETPTRGTLEDREAVEAAHRAYYAAWEVGDPQAIMDVWADDDRVCYILPGNGPNHGRTAVRERVMETMTFAAGLQFLFTEIDVTVSGDVARLTCVETVISPDTFGGDEEMAAALAKLAVTSLFMRTADGWKMWHHQAGPMLTHLRLERE